jgi:hypothetical protein
VIAPPRTVPPEARIVAAATAALSAGPSHPRYLAALAHAVWEEPLACSTPLYAEMHATASQDGQWTVVSLLRQAARAADEARRRWARAGGCADPEARSHLERDAVGRSEHVLRYLDLVDIAFPEAMTPQFRQELDGLAPGYTVDQPLPNAHESHQPLAPAEIVMLNLDGLRMTILDDLVHSAIARHCSPDDPDDPDDRARAAAVLDGVRRDHRAEVAWTARWIEQATATSRPDELAALLVRCLRRFNRATMEEPIDLSYHQRFGNYP